MLKKIFENIILKYPIAVLLALVPLFLYFGFVSTHLKIDATSKSLLMDNDPDLAFLKKINKDFYNPDILLVTFRPNSPLLSKESLNTIKNLSDDLVKIPNIDSVTSILTVPLLENKNLPITDLVDKVPTLQSKDVNLTLAKKEFLTSPLYKNALVSSDFTTTALVLNLKSNQKGLLNRHEYLQKIREYLSHYQDKGKLFLGGVDMIADDMIGFVKSDIFLYGSTLTLLLIVILWIIFREIKWVFIPMLISVLSIITTAALIVLFGWEITVISSNFVSLQLIITLSIILHLIVKYRELEKLEPSFSQKELVLYTITSKAKPSFYAIATTVVGFASLTLSGIKPVIYLGLMMSIGISVSLVVSFVMFAAIVILFKRNYPKEKKPSKKNFSFIKNVIKIVEKKEKSVYVVTILLLLFSLTGIPRLIVENSFINYFKSSTEIYKSLKTIDQELGGTTPLDVVIMLKEKKQKVQTPKDSDEDSFDDFESEFEQDANDPKYWFTPTKLSMVEKVHDYLQSIPYIGNVQSLATLLKLGRILKHGKELDNFELALIYKKLPKKFKKILLSPYINIEKNELRVATRIKDSDKSLRRNKLLHKIEKDLKKMIDPKIANFRLGNMMVLYNNMLQSLFKSQILTLGATLAALFVMFIVLFKSVKVALIALLANIIPIGVIFGVMGWGEIPLDMMTITIAAISIGIGVDDTIHYIHRYKEEFKKDKNYIKAMRRAHESIGYAMYYTSLAIIIGFSILITSNFIPTIYFGLLTVVVMFFALLSSLILLPILLIRFKPYKKL
ncbi:MAG: MMPL family transporter [Epsilonproteobacteria bacterium]|nr:MMPL family transporter [Campylobacterota bacterium]